MRLHHSGDLQDPIERLVLGIGVIIGELSIDTVSHFRLVRG